MPKPKSAPPLPGLPKSEDERQQQARLAANFDFWAPRLGFLKMSVARADASLTLANDEAAQTRRLQRDARARQVEAMEDGRIRRRYLAEQRELDRSIERYWRRVRARMRKVIDRVPRPRKDGRRHSVRPAAMGVKLPSYSGPVLDALGRRSVYMDVRYQGARRSNIGIAGRMIRYISRPDGVEHGADGEPLVVSNVGENFAERYAAFDLIETLNRAARGNGKIVFTAIVNLPHDIPAEARLEILKRFCEEAFGAYDLPYVAAVHEAPEEGDQRNTHGHVVFSLRPLRRVGDHEWDAGTELLTEFDKPERFAHYRKLFAEVMTEVAQEQGKRRVYTELSNAARGLKNKPTEKLGAGRTAAVRRNEIDPVNERNRMTIAENETLLRADRRKRRLARLAHAVAELYDIRGKIAALAGVVRLPPSPPVVSDVTATPAMPSQPIDVAIRAGRVAASGSAERVVRARPIAPVPTVGESIEAKAISRPPADATVVAEPVTTPPQMSSVSAFALRTGLARRGSRDMVTADALAPWRTPRLRSRSVAADRMIRPARADLRPFDPALDPLAIAERMRERDERAEKRRRVSQRVAGRPSAAQGPRNEPGLG